VSAAIPTAEELEAARAAMVRAGESLDLLGRLPVHGGRRAYTPEGRAAAERLYCSAVARYEALILASEAAAKAVAP